MTMELDEGDDEEEGESSIANSSKNSVNADSGNKSRSTVEAAKKKRKSGGG